jgi:hypothetical protein
VTAQRRHQVTDIAPAPAPKVIEYVAQAKQCAGCGTVTAGELSSHLPHPIYLIARPPLGGPGRADPAMGLT